MTTSNLQEDVDMNDPETPESIYDREVRMLENNTRLFDEVTRVMRRTVDTIGWPQYYASDVERDIRFLKTSFLEHVEPFPFIFWWLIRRSGTFICTNPPPDYLVTHIHKVVSLEGQHFHIFRYSGLSLGSSTPQAFYRAAGKDTRIGLKRFGYR